MNNINTLKDTTTRQSTHTHTCSYSYTCRRNKQLRSSYEVKCECKSMRMKTKKQKQNEHIWYIVIWIFVERNVVLARIVQSNPLILLFLLAKPVAIEKSVRISVMNNSYLHNLDHNEYVSSSITSWLKFHHQTKNRSQSLKFYRTIQNWIILEKIEFC